MPRPMTKRERAERAMALQETTESDNSVSVENLLAMREEVLAAG